MLVCFLLIKRISGHLNQRASTVTCDHVSNSERSSSVPRAWKQIYWRVIMLNINKTSRTIHNGIWQRSQRLQVVEIRKMVSFAKYGWLKKSQSWSLWKSKIQIYALPCTAVFKSIALDTLKNTTLHFILDNSALKICWLFLARTLYFSWVCSLKKFGQKMIKLRRR